MDSQTQALKKDCRAHFRNLQSSYSDDQFREWNRALTPKLLSTLKAVPPLSFVAAYRSRPREASLMPLFGLPFQFCFPKVLSASAMEFKHVKRAKEEDEFQIGAYGILEPKPEHPVVDHRVMAAAFIPLLAFDARGGRMGYGKGYYDRILSSFPGLKIGVAFEWQFSHNPLPLEAHDVRLDMVVTERSLREFK